MPSALVLIADGTEEIEFVTPYDGKLVELALQVTFATSIVYARS
jgi:hypothetical protein